MMTSRARLRRRIIDVLAGLYPVVVSGCYYYLCTRSGHGVRGVLPALAASAGYYGVLGVFLSYDLAWACKSKAWYVRLLWCLVITVAPVGVPWFYFAQARRRLPGPGTDDPNNIWYVVFVRKPFFAYLVTAGAVIGVCVFWLVALWPT